MEALLLSLLLWINQNSHYTYDANHGLPELRAADQMTLAAMIIDDESTLMRDQHSPSFKDFVNQLEAVYDHKNQVILISSKIDMHSGYGHSVIVHELVHFVQYQHQIHHDVACLNALERDAYDIQARYMEAHHIPKNFDDLTIALRSLCLDYAE